MTDVSLAAEEEEEEEEEVVPPYKSYMCPIFIYVSSYGSNLIYVSYLIHVSSYGSNLMCVLILLYK